MSFIATNYSSSQRHGQGWIVVVTLLAALLAKHSVDMKKIFFIDIQFQYHGRRAFRASRCRRLYVDRARLRSFHPADLRRCRLYAQSVYRAFGLEGEDKK